MSSLRENKIYDFMFGGICIFYDKQNMLCNFQSYNFDEMITDIRFYFST
jgi:hypothetical protein